LSRFAADVLELIPKPFTPHNAPIQYLARGMHWQLLSDAFAVEEVFAIAMFSFEEYWQRCTDINQQIPSVEMYHDCLVHALDTIQRVLNRNPRSVEAMWELWVADKVQQLTMAAAAMEHGHTHGHVVEENVAHHDGHAGDIKPSAQKLLLMTNNVTGSVLSTNVSAPIVTPPSSSRSSHSSQSEPMEEFGLSVNSYVRGADERVDVCTDESPQDGTPSKPGHQVVTDHDSAISNTTPALVDVGKQIAGVASTVIGGSNILAPVHIRQLEAALPNEYQCMNWRQVFR
jgi:hypothetical protein